jgi:hypothetical protein
MSFNLCGMLLEVWGLKVLGQNLRFLLTWYLPQGHWNEPRAK